MSRIRINQSVSVPLYDHSFVGPLLSLFLSHLSSFYTFPCHQRQTTLHNTLPSIAPFNCQVLLCGKHLATDLFLHTPCPAFRAIPSDWSRDRARGADVSDPIPTRGEFSPLVRTPSGRQRHRPSWKRQCSGDLTPLAQSACHVCCSGRIKFRFSRNVNFGHVCVDQKETAVWASKI